MTVIVSRLVISVTAVPVESTTVSEHGHRNRDVTQHHQQPAADENRKKHRTSLHERPRFYLALRR